MLQNSLKQHIKKLHQKKYRKEFGEFLVEGIKGVAEAMNSGADMLALIVEGKRRDEPDMAALVHDAMDKDIDVAFCGREDIGDIKTTETFPGIQAIIAQPETDLADIMGKSPIICLDQVNDPGNLGTIIRTADWFGMNNIVVSEGSVDPYNDKVVRSTMGSLFRTKIVQTLNVRTTLEKLKENGYSVVALSMEGNSISKQPIDVGKPTVLLFGSESHGVRDELADLVDNTYAIPGAGRAESLNLGISAGIVMYSIFS